MGHILSAHVYNCNTEAGVLNRNNRSKNSLIEDVTTNTGEAILRAPIIPIKSPCFSITVWLLECALI